MHKIQSILMLVSVISLILVLPVNAQERQPTEQPWTNEETVVRPDLGPKEVGLTPGVNGYKVFNPGAIKSEPIKPIGKLAISPEATLYRRFYTDAYIKWLDGDWHYRGSHVSESDLYEQKIWVDGWLKVSKTWVDDCLSHKTNVRRATCTTDEVFWCGYSSYAESDHFFHTSGYIDAQKTTWDNGGC